MPVEHPLLALHPSASNDKGIEQSERREHSGTPCLFPLAHLALVSTVGGDDSGAPSPPAPLQASQQDHGWLLSTGASGASADVTHFWRQYALTNAAADLD